MCCVVLIHVIVLIQVRLSFQRYRVIALASREVTAEDQGNIHSWKRSDAEQKMKFNGFLVLSARLKAESRSAVRRLQVGF